MGTENHKSLNTFIEKLVLKRPDSTFEAYLCISNLPFQDLIQRKETFLHSEELAYFGALRFERRQKSFLMGRYCAKLAISKYANEPDMTTFSIRHGIFEHPLVKHLSKKDSQISISHSDECGGAIAFPEEHPMAIDLEKINPKKKEAIQTQCTPDELALIRSLQATEIAQLTLLWTVKEALSKALRCGLMAPFMIFEVKDLVSHSDCFVWTFKKFAQYKAISFIMGNVACSVITPKKTEFEIHVKDLEKIFHT